LPAKPGDKVTATIIAQSASSLALTYTWTTSSSDWQIISGGSTPTATITAPSGYSITGTATIEVSDTQGRSIGVIALSTEGNSMPVINSISIYPQPVYTAANLVCSAYDPDGDALTYDWTIGGLPITTGSNSLWYSPGIPGYYLAGITVNDGNGGVVNGSSPIVIASASPYPKFHYGIQSTGLSPINTSAITGTVKWKYRTGNSVYSSPAIGADGTIYIGSQDDYVYALNPTDGSVKWKYGTSYYVNSSPAIGADGTIYIGSFDYSVYALH
jgi:outer membrane protein assembly factor BamB